MGVGDQFTRDKGALGQRIRDQLTQVTTLRDAVRADPVAAQDRLLLRAWQAERLASTYPDLLASARYRPAAQFFLSDLYGPKDFAERDAEAARIVPTMTRMLPASALETFALAIELDCLSEILDGAMVEALRKRQRRTDQPLLVSAETYAQAYRACGNPHERARQIELVAEIGHELDRLSRKPMLAAAIELMRVPAHAAGLGELHDFLEHGFKAFRHMAGAEEFLATIDRRERLLSQRLFAGEPDPFERLD